MKYYQRDEMFMNGGIQSEVKIILRYPLNYDDNISYYIIVLDNSLAYDWLEALKQLLQSNNLLEKNYCFMGFPKTLRNLEMLCDELNKSVHQINKFNSELHWIKAGLPSYIIEEFYSPDSVRFGKEYSVPNRTHPEGDSDYHHIQNLGLSAKKMILNQLHNHFEVLQGTVEEPSKYYLTADYETKYAIRQLNILCHEIENLILSQQKEITLAEWIRPSQITSWLHAPRHELTSEHRKLFLKNGYDRKFGYVYMHWAQIGKTLFEVFRDEDAPQLNDSTCHTITHLKYYSGEFDVEWGLDVVGGKGSRHFWHVEQQNKFKKWLIQNNFDPEDENLSLGYLPIGVVDLERSFGTTDHFQIWDLLSNHLDIYSIQIGETTKIYDYCWADANYKQMQIDIMRPGYDFSSRR